MLRKLVNKKPDYLDACIALSDILCAQEMYKEALSIMNETAKYNLNNFDVYYNLGIIYTMLNDFSNAKLCYEKASVINSINYNSNYNIAMINLILGELEDAQKQFIVCIDSEELSPLAYYELAKICIIKSEKETAIKYLNIAIDIEPAMYNKIIEDSTFAVIKGYINYPNIDDEDFEKEEILNMNEKENKVLIHLEQTYDLVSKLNYKEMGIKYNNVSKDFFANDLEVEDIQK